MELAARDRRIAFPRRPLVMGIININDDSFSADGRIDPAWALGEARRLTAQGADILDIGAESARTNRAAIAPEEEFRRLRSVLEGVSSACADATPRDEEQIFPPLLSINTWRPEVAEPALAIAGDILNDMGALPDDTNARLCAATGAALLIMHSVGAPKIPHTHVSYDDIMQTLDAFFAEKIALAEAAGLATDRILLDPGIDFAKQAADNLRIYRELPRLARFGRPLLLPVSRKGVIGDVLGLPDPRDRDAGTAACIVAGHCRGAHIFRVHNVDMAWRVVQSMDRLLRG